MRGHAPEVVVYTREGCGLCRTAEELAERERGRASVRLVDVDADPELTRRFGLRVPVVVVDGVEVAEGHVRRGQVRSAVRSARRRWRRRGGGGPGAPAGTGTDPAGFGTGSGGA